jgi:hypothetical protein
MRIDASDMSALSRDLGKIGARSTAAMFGVFKESGEDLRKMWQRNARATSGTHGKRYPDSITMDMLVGREIGVEVGPDPRLPQGGMSFEYGSVNQPPHLDGQRAADEEIPKIDKRITTALGLLGL